jgi:hypothetical protein
LSGTTTEWVARDLALRDRDYPLITPLATRRCQMNSTTTAPIVAMMKPAPWSGL